MFYDLRFPGHLFRASRRGLTDRTTPSCDSVDPSQATLATDAPSMESISGLSRLAVRSRRSQRPRSLRLSKLRLAIAAVTLSVSTAAFSATVFSADDAATGVRKAAYPLPAARLAEAIPTGTATASEEEVLNEGYAYERQRQWAEAVHHYESAMRNHPQSRAIYQRLLISRLRYDVNRRYNDHSFLASVREMNLSQALDLYSEMLANLETHYVEDVDWSRVILHGTAALEVALDEDIFVSTVLPNTDADAIDRFRLNVHRELKGRSVASRFDLRGSVDFVARLAHQELGLAGTATALEFLAGAASSLDPYTRLLSGSQLDEMFSNIEGNFVGLGIELEAGEDCLKILSVIPGGPADEAGIRAGEKIVRVATTDTATVDPDYAADLLRGPENSTVSIAIRGLDGKSRDLNVPRRRVDVPCVENVHMVDQANRIGYFRLTNFQKTTTREVEQALFALQSQGMRSLVMDLRGNPGGLLTAAVEVADRFLSDGRIVTTRGRNVKENFDYQAHRSGTWPYPLVVLIDGNSASASEIFAGAMADRGRATVVGEISYGKGSVQGVFRMRSAKFGLCLTTAKFYSPDGHAISQNGVVPHVAVGKSYITARPNDEGGVTTDLEDRALQQGIAQLIGRSESLVSQRPTR